MALLRSVLGTITQSIGGVTATTWKGKNVLKQKVAATNTSNTPAQQVQRRKFAALATLGGKMGPAIRVGYRLAAATVTEQNAFYTANKEVVSDNGTLATVNYAEIQVSTGIVAPVTGLTVYWDTVNGTAQTEWDDNSNGSDALPTDEGRMVLIDTVKGDVYVGVFSDPRNNGELGEAWPAKKGVPAANIRAYVYFKRAAGSATSPSVTVQCIPN